MFCTICTTFRCHSHTLSLPQKRQTSVSFFKGRIMPLLPASVSVQWREMVIFLEEGIKGLYQIIDRNSKPISRLSSFGIKKKNIHCPYLIKQT